MNEWIQNHGHLPEEIGFYDLIDIMLVDKGILEERRGIHLNWNIDGMLCDIAYWKKSGCNKLMVQ